MGFLAGGLKGPSLAATVMDGIPKNICNRVLESLDMNPYMANKPERRVTKTLRYNSSHNRILPPQSFVVGENRDRISRQVSRHGVCDCTCH